MNSGSIGSTSPLLKRLENNGLSATKAKLVVSDLAAAEKGASGGAATTGLSPSVRAAFEARISADVLSGKLSASDAAAVRKTMGGLDGGATAAASGQATAAASGTSAGASAGSGSGGGGGGGSGKTELSETITVSGSTMTTVITYTDGTTSTTTAVASDADKARYEKPASGTSASRSTDGYAATIDKGSLVDQIA